MPRPLFIPGNFLPLSTIPMEKGVRFDVSKLIGKRCVILLYAKDELSGCNSLIPV